MNCLHCGKPVVLSPSAAERAAKYSGDHPASYYTALFPRHAECVLEMRKASQTKEAPMTSPITG